MIDSSRIRMGVAQGKEQAEINLFTSYKSEGGRGARPLDVELSGGERRDANLSSTEPWWKKKKRFEVGLILIGPNRARKGRGGGGGARETYNCLQTCTPRFGN